MQHESWGAICAECGWLGRALFAPAEGDAWPVACPVCESDELAYYAGPFDGGAAS